MKPLEHAAHLLRDAHRPVLLIGRAAATAVAQVERLRARLGAPILTTPEAKSLVDEARPEAGGSFSFAASERADRLVRVSDLVLAIGSDLGEFASRGGRAFRGKVLIQLVDDAHDIATSVTPDVIVLQDLCASSSALAELFPTRERQRPWFEADKVSCVRALRRADSAGPGLQPETAMASVRASLPARVRLACDVTSATLVLLRDAALNPEQRLWCNLERSACMGAAVAAGLGLRLASGLPTLVIIGDWGLTMGSSELHTIASLSVSGLVVLVWSNGGGALIRAGVKAQEIAVSPDLHTWPAPPDFVQVGRGYGLPALRVRSAAALRRALGQGLKAARPTLIEVVIAPDAEVPAGDRYLHLSASTEPGP